MDAGRLGRLWGGFRKMLRNPIQLRFLVGVGMLAAWYFALFAPVSEGIAQAELDRQRHEAHLKLAREIEALRAQADKFRDRVPPGADKREWVEYMISGIRAFPVKLLKLEPQGTKTSGPFELLVLKVEIQGSFKDLEALLSWLEFNPRLLRIDVVNIQKGKGAGEGLLLRLTVLGVMG